jgi:4-hydroxybenzoate polyprenyltransferase
MRDRWWMRPIRERWFETDPANFFLAAALLVVVLIAVLAALASWNLWLLLIALIVVALWSWGRRRA